MQIFCLFFRVMFLKCVKSTRFCKKFAYLFRIFCLKSFRKFARFLQDFDFPKFLLNAFFAKRFLIKNVDFARFQIIRALPCLYQAVRLGQNIFAKLANSRLLRSVDFENLCKNFAHF